MTDSDKHNIEGQLRRVLETLDVANALTEPLTESIAELLKISSQSLSSGEASVIIRDGNGSDLRFLSAVGQVADQLIGMKIPSGKGIAGFVFSSGQPMVVSDVGQEESFYAEVDKQTGYSTQMILATPLRHKDEVIGVLEFINRVGEPPYEPFTPDEMDRAALYGEAIASLVHAYESAKLFRELQYNTLKSDAESDLKELREWVLNLRSTVEHREMIDLAILVREIASRGTSERQLCREVLEAFLRHSQSDKETSFLDY